MYSVHSAPESIADSEPLVLGAEVVGPDGGVGHGRVPLPGEVVLLIFCTVQCTYCTLCTVFTVCKLYSVY